MNLNDDVTLLIDAIVRQTVVLVAQLATTGGRRAPLAHVANQVFLGLVEEIQRQGVNQKVTADMFGMALRTYQRKRHRLMESATEQGRSLWEALLTFIQDNGLVNRRIILEHFRNDDENTIRGLLSDLVDTGLIFRTGYGTSTSYRATTQDEQGAMTPEDSLEARATIVWIAVYRSSPVTFEQLQQVTGLQPEALEETLERLESDKRVEISEEEGERVYLSRAYMIPFGSRVGWGAAVFDHYQAMVGALCAKLQEGGGASHRRDAIGGSTFSFDVWDGHPFEDEVIGLLGELRDRVHTMRSRVDTFNERFDEPQGTSRRVVFYLGQNVISDEEV